MATLASLKTKREEMREALRRQNDLLCERRLIFAKEERFKTAGNAAEEKKAHDRLIEINKELRDNLAMLETTSIAYLDERERAKPMFCFGHDNRNSLLGVAALLLVCLGLWWFLPSRKATHDSLATITTRQTKSVEYRIDPAESQKLLQCTYEKGTLEGERNSQAEMIAQLKREKKEDAGRLKAEIDGLVREKEAKDRKIAEMEADGKETDKILARIRLRFQ